MSAKHTFASLLILLLFLLPPAWQQWQPEGQALLANFSLHLLWLAVLAASFWVLNNGHR